MFHAVPYEEDVRRFFFSSGRVVRVCVCVRMWIVERSSSIPRAGLLTCHAPTNSQTPIPYKPSPSQPHHADAYAYQHGNDDEEVDCSQTLPPFPTSTSNNPKAAAADARKAATAPAPPTAAGGVKGVITSSESWWLDGSAAPGGLHGT